MTEDAPLIFWQYVPSPQEAALVRAVAERWEGPVTVITEQDRLGAYREPGWESPDFGAAELIVGPTRSDRLGNLNEAGDEAVHLFSGFHEHPETFWTFRRALRSRATVGVVADPGDDREGPVKPHLRRVRCMIQAARYARRLDLLFSPGTNGVRWYRSCGFPAENMIPFAHYTEPSASPDAETFERPSDDTFELLFVGPFVPRLGLDLLLRALGGLRTLPWRLTVVGAGTAASSLRALADREALTPHVRWRGSVPRPEAVELMAGSDCLVLPGRFDAWGAVANEALLVGTPVLTSEACGASDLLQSERLGSVVRSEDVDHLREALARRIRSGPPAQSERTATREWAGRVISPAAGAHYLIEILHARKAGRAAPAPPWRCVEALVRT